VSLPTEKLLLESFSDVLAGAEENQANDQALRRKH